MIALICGYMALIAFLSLVPMDSGAKNFRFLVAVQPGVQNLMHIPAYALLVILWMQVLTQQGGRNPGKIILVFSVCAGFGMVNEFAQVWVPGRYPSLTDIVTNLLGCIFGLQVYRIRSRNARV